ncbi:MAG: FeMo cofactor biosynthesis protein NifB [Pelotomaculum sp. PtaU1.Bin035]|nr:MAG: FeMo cofactor biosynthesis protein NifB [Pelotomaculum sp. PtaU1.Bin035]
MVCDAKSAVSQHPCFNHAARRWFSCVHLPVAISCNIKCRYCSREYACVNENYKKAAGKTVSQREALKKMNNYIKNCERVRVVGVAGPGEPLANKETIEVLTKVNSHYPHLVKCVCTNGLMLEDNLHALLDAGVKTIAVTVNAVDPAIGGEIYRWVFYKNKPYHGTIGACLLLEKQLAGIREAKKSGIMVKVNSILIPGINDFHLREVAIAVKEAGAFVMNIVPIVPQAEFSLIQPPGSQLLRQAKEEIEPIIHLAESCR